MYFWTPCITYPCPAHRLWFTGWFSTAKTSHTQCFALHSDPSFHSLHMNKEVTTYDRLSIPPPALSLLIKQLAQASALQSVFYNHTIHMILGCVCMTPIYIWTKRISHNCPAQETQSLIPFNCSSPGCRASLGFWPHLDRAPVGGYKSINGHSLCKRS